MLSSRRFPSLSLEFIEYTVLEQTQHLLSMRCYDMGFIPYVSPNGDNHVKLWGPPFFSRFFNQMQVPANLVKVNLETKLADLNLQSLQPVLIHKCLRELYQMESVLNQMYDSNLTETQNQIEQNLADKEVTLGELYRSLAERKI